MSDSVDSLGLRLLFALPLSPLSPYLSVNFLMCHFLFIGVIFVILWEMILQFTQTFESGNQPLNTKAVLKQMTGSID